MSLRWRLVLGYAFGIAAVIAFLGVLLVQRMRSEMLGAVDRELDARAKALAGVLEFEDGAWSIDPDSGLDFEYEKNPLLYYVVREGPLLSVVVKSKFAPADAGAPNATGRDRRIGDVHFREWSWFDWRFREESRALSRSGQSWMTVTCGMNVAATEAAVNELIYQLLIIGPLMLMASIVGGLRLLEHVFRPIDQMAQTAERISETNLDRRIPVKTHDELGVLADTLNATFDRLQQGFERERRFTADASHELRTPLAVIAGNVEVALNKDRPPAEYRQMLGDIGEAAARMQAIVEGLLTLARVDRHTPPRDRHPVALAPICEDVVRLHRPIAVRAGVSLYLATDPKIEVKADAEALKTVVSNLISNAIRYNHDGGRVGIGVARENGVVRIRVEDTGIGIPKEHLPHLFERFYRVDPARTAASGGVGLGLAIANAIVAAHHGTIAIESEPGRGTKVEVRLPA